MISVIIPTRNPRPDYLSRTLAALNAQTLERTRWEVLLVDNASAALLPLPDFVHRLPRFAVLAEPALGLTPARLCGIRVASGDVLVFVDDDNVLAPDHLATVERLFSDQPHLGAAGGPVQPEFDAPPPEWTREFYGLLALQDHGAGELIAHGSPTARWPAFAPVGAGLCVRRTAALPYLRALSANPSRRSLDRAGRSLASGGDNDLVFTVLRLGWNVGYFPGLRLTHLIPPGRLAPDYLGRLNEGIQRSWVRVLALHGENPWPPVPRWTVPLRSARAWWRTRAWSSPAHRIRWRGLHGRFLGQADLAAAPRTTGA